jgi:phage terminase large subunit GpA-like protein
VSLARKRSATFWNRRMVATSTPTIKDASRIEQLYETSDKRRYYINCPHCDHETVIQWANIQWIDDDPSTAKWCCPECGGLVGDVDKPRLLRSGHWVAEAETDGIAGFHISELYSPWRTWAEVVKDFLVARSVQKTGDHSLMQVWVNTSLGETWEEVGHTVDGHALMNRREAYTVPNEVNVITIGADCQDNRVEFEVVGWCGGETSYGLEYKIVHGDLSKVAFWDNVARLMNRTYKREDGVLLDCKLVCIDSGGHFTDEVYSFSRKNGLRHFLPIKGSSIAGKPIATMPKKPNAKRVYLTQIGTDTAKEVIYRRFDLEEGQGACHFPMTYTEEWFDQATSEKKMVRYTKGMPRMEWHLPSGRSNEALDCRVYAFAAVRILQQYFGVDLSLSPKPPPPPKDKKQPARVEPQRFARRTGSGFSRR